MPHPRPPPVMGKGGHLEAPGHGVGHHTGKWQRGGLIRTAAAHRSRWVSWDRGVAEEFRGGDGKWGALGEVRRAAVEIREDQSNQGRGALKIANGPDGSRGFRSQRTRQVIGETGLEKVCDIADTTQRTRSGTPTSI